MKLPDASTMFLFLLAVLVGLALVASAPSICDRIIAGEDARIEKLDRDLPRARREIIIASWKNFL